MGFRRAVGLGLAGTGGTARSGKLPSSTTTTSSGSATGNAAGSGTPASAGSGAGVGTSIGAHQPITVGVLLTPTASTASYGISTGESYSEKDVDQALIDAVNRQGGLAGHKLVPVYASTDPNGSNWSTEFAAACASFTQDHHVQAVLGGWAVLRTFRHTARGPANAARLPDPAPHAGSRCRSAGNRAALSLTWGSMLFMSPEHVAMMNQIIASSPEVLAGASHLDRVYVLAYDLADVPAGHAQHWTVSVGPDEIRFGLEPVDEADVRLVGDWRRIVAASRANREGRKLDPQVQTIGDPAALERIGRVLALAQMVATVPVDWPAETLS